MFLINTSGIKTHHDNELVSFFPFETEFNRKYSYKPFDIRYINYDIKKVVRPRYTVMKNFIADNNYGLLLMRNQVNSKSYSTVGISNTLTDINYYGFQTYIFPLYLYEASTQASFFDQSRKPNLNMDIMRELEQKLNLTFTPEKEDNIGTFAPIDILDYIYGVLYSNKYRNKYKEFLKIDFPIDILDYIYGVLYSNKYRNKYKEFLKIDFPRIPYPKNANYFFKIAQLGKQLRKIHLFESPVVNEFITSYPIDGDNDVIKPQYKDNKVYINKTQYFDNVPETTWNFYIGGYQPAQKWLKDRKGRILSYEDVIHYQKIIKALTETNNLMHQIDEIIEV